MTETIMIVSIVFCHIIRIHTIVSIVLTETCIECDTTPDRSSRTTDRFDSFLKNQFYKNIYILKARYKKKAKDTKIGFRNDHLYYHQMIKNCHMMIFLSSDDRKLSCDDNFLSTNKSLLQAENFIQRKRVLRPYVPVQVHV